MCLAAPARIISVNKEMAAVEVFGAIKEVSLYLLPEAARAGDYVLVHAGFAINKLDPEAAREALLSIQEMADAVEKWESEAESLEI